MSIQEIYLCSDDLEKYNQLQYTLLSDDEDLNLNIQDIQVLLVQALVYRLLVFAYEVQIQYNFLKIGKKYKKKNVKNEMWVRIFDLLTKKISL